MRSTRNQPFCWQEKTILRILRKTYSGSLLGKLRNLYLTITEMDSDFNNQDIKYYTKTIATYSGLSDEWIPEGLKLFENHEMIRIEEDKEKGKFKGKRLIFTPENVKEMPVKTVTGKTGNGKTGNGEIVTGFSGTLEDSTLLEDSILLEDNSLKEDVKASENTDAKLSIKNNHPEKLAKINKRILPIVQKAFSAVDFSNKLPAESDETCNSKTYEAIQTFFYNLHECKIKSAYAWNDKWIKRNHIDFAALREKTVGMNGNSRLPFEVIEEILEKSLKNYILMRKEGYWPPDKTNLTLNFKDFLYNYKAQSSWFLFCLFNEPKQLQETIAENVIKDLPKNVQNLIVDFGEGIHGQDTWPRLSYYTKIKDLYLWYTARLKKFKKYHDLKNQGGWYSALGSFDDLISMIDKFMDTWQNKWNVGNFGRGCKTWNLFTAWVQKEFGFELDVSDKVLNEYEKRYDERFLVKEKK
jgi:hypothetical protein